MVTIYELQTLNLTSVTELYRKKASGMVAHAGLLLEFTCGRQAVLHNTPERGAHLSSFVQFSENQNVNITKQYFSELDIMKQRIVSILSKKNKYSVFDNCEHLASEVITGIAKSPQLQATIAGTAIGTALGCSIANNKTLGGILGALVGGFVSLQCAKACKL
ncbi:hypothetical protein [Photobacterium sanguinicancri]|uniref:LRAT domain-containing protein n=1 Tax=Photobacterium sanguinicancri TaxID=875932 RepID=A0AAW7Y2H6_9GAMM|nr:hypothetical protein [Photobacterium sanguinicancri]MDO6542798.1 hypothetical protein [Photobacterium sanguinicancri]